MSEAGARPDRRRLWREVRLTWREVGRLLNRNPLVLLLVVLAIGGFDAVASWFLGEMSDLYLPSRWQAFHLMSDGIRILLAIASTWLTFLIVFYGGDFPLPAGASIKSRPALRLLFRAVWSWLLIELGVGVLRAVLGALLRLVSMAFYYVQVALSEWALVLTNTLVTAALTSAILVLVLRHLPGSIVYQPDRRSQTRSQFSVLFASSFPLLLATGMATEIAYLTWHWVPLITGSIRTSLDSSLPVLLVFAIYRRTEITDHSVAHIFD